MREAWKELMNAYTQALQNASGSTDSVLEALENLQAQINSSPDKRKTDKMLSELAQELGGLPVEEKGGTNTRLYFKLKNALSKYDNYDEVENLLERSIYHAAKFPSLAQQNTRENTVDPMRVFEELHREQESEKAQQAQAGPSIFGRMLGGLSRMSQTVLNVFSPTTSPREEPAIISPAQTAKETPTQTQVEDAWRRLVSTYQSLSSGHEKWKMAMEDMYEKAERKEENIRIPTFEKSFLVDELKNFDEITSRLELGEKELREKMGLPKGDYSKLFRELIGTPPTRELRQLFIDTFSEASLAWQKQEQKEVVLGDAWKNLVGAYQKAFEKLSSKTTNFSEVFDALAKLEKIIRHDPLAAEKLKHYAESNPLVTKSADKTDTLYDQLKGQCAEQKGNLALLEKTFNLATRSVSESKPIEQPKVDAKFSSH
jgi:hypothetical protein